MKKLHNLKEDLSKLVKLIRFWLETCASERFQLQHSNGQRVEVIRRFLLSFVHIYPFDLEKAQVLEKDGLQEWARDNENRDLAQVAAELFRMTDELHGCVCTYFVELYYLDMCKHMHECKCCTLCMIMGNLYRMLILNYFLRYTSILSLRPLLTRCSVKFVGCFERGSEVKGCGFCE